MITDLGDLVKEIVLAFYGVNNITDIEFLEWVGSFVLVYVILKAYMYIVGGD